MQNVWCLRPGGGRRACAYPAGPAPRGCDNSRVTLGRTRRAELALVLLSLIWGSTFVVVKAALADSSTLLFLALRFALAATALVLAFRPSASALRQNKRQIAGGVLAGVFLFTGYLLQTAGLRYTTPSKSAFITGLSIVLTPVMAALFERKAPRLLEAAGVAVATAGLALLTLPGETLRMGKGDLLTLACAVAFAAQILVVDWYASSSGFQTLALTQIATAMLLSLGTFWWAERPQILWSRSLVLAVLITGLLATALAFAVQAWAQRYTTPTRTALIFALEPVFAWATSFLLTGELLPRQATLGAALILAGILLAEIKPAAWRESST